MRQLIAFVYLFVSLFTSLPASAALTDFDRQEIAAQNILAPYNSGFEAGKANWTASAGTLTRVITGSNLLTGKGSATWDAAASGNTLTSKAVTIPNGLYGRNCEASIVVMTPSGTATHSLQAYDGSNILVTNTIISSTTPKPNTVYFPCPTSGTIALRLYANANEPLLVVDEAYLGIATGVASSNYSTSAPTITKYTSGSGTYTPPAGATRLRIRMVGGGGGGGQSGTTGGSDPTDGGDTTFGSNLTAAKGLKGSRGSGGGAGGAATITAPAIGTGTTGQAGQGSQWSNPGTGNVATNGGQGGSTPLGGGGAGGVYNGAGGGAATNTGGGGGGGGGSSTVLGVYTGGGGGAGAYVEAWITNSMSIWASSFSYAVGAAGSAGTAGTSGYAGGAGAAGYIEITEYYDGAGTVVTPPAQGWYVAANISGTSPDLGVANVTSYTEIVSSALTMTPVSGSQPVAVMCSTTNAATAPTTSTSTCAAGSESLGANFNIPVAGTYEVCANFTHRAAFDTIEQAQPTFQLIETPLAAQTLTLEGGAKISSGGTALNIATGADAVQITPFGLCSMFKWTSAGNKGVRLMYEQAVTGTPDGSSVVTDGDTNNGQRDFYITVKPVTPTMQAPLLVGSITSSQVGAIRMESAKFGSTGTISQETGDWVNGNASVASAVYTITLNSSQFSSAPNCTVSSYGETTDVQANVESTSTSTIKVRTYNQAGSATAAAFMLICMGPR